MADEVKTVVEAEEPVEIVMIDIEKALPNGEFRVRQCAAIDFEYFRRKGFKKIK